MAIKTKYISRYIGAILLVFYMLSFYMYYNSDETNQFYTFTVLILYFFNIIWILIYYSAYLNENKPYITKLRWIIIIRIVVFMSLTLFRLTPQFGYFNSTSSLLYFIVLIMLMFIILSVDKTICFEKRER